MTLRKLQHLGLSWRVGLMWLAASLLCVPVIAEPSVKVPPLLTPWSALTGAWVAAPLRHVPPLPGKPSFSGYLTWQAPTLISARGNYVYLVDARRRQIFRYDISQQTMVPFADYAAGSVASIAVGPDLSLYVADVKARQVLHYSFEGRLLRTFANDMELAQPVALVLDEPTGNLWVADGLRNYVVVFSSLGRVLSVLRSNEARSIEAMAHGPDGLYLVDRLSRQVVVVGLDGADRYILGQGTLKNPGVIAVDRFNRVFVSDSFDNTIKVYEQDELVASIGNSGTTPASFNRITSLWIDHNVLYAADALNARILTFHVALPGARLPPP
jgi:hypothetical protein